MTASGAIPVKADSVVSDIPEWVLHSVPIKESGDIVLTEVGVVENFNEVIFEDDILSDSTAKLNTVLNGEMKFVPKYVDRSTLFMRTAEVGCTNTNYVVFYRQLYNSSDIFYACYTGAGTATFRYGYHNESTVYGVCPGKNDGMIHYRTVSGYEDWSTRRWPFNNNSSPCFRFADSNFEPPELNMVRIYESLG